MFTCAQVRGTLDPSNRNRYIATLPGLGFQFVAEVTEVSDAQATADSHAIQRVSVSVADLGATGAVGPAPEEIIQAVVSLYVTKGYNSRGLELCRRSLSLPPAEQERILAEMEVQQPRSN